MAKKDGLIEKEALLRFLTGVVEGTVMDERIVVEQNGEGYSEARAIEIEVPVRDKIEAVRLLLSFYGE